MKTRNIDCNSNKMIRKLGTLRKMPRSFGFKIFIDVMISHDIFTSIVYDNNKTVL